MDRAWYRPQHGTYGAADGAGRGSDVVIAESVGVPAVVTGVVPQAPPATTNVAGPGRRNPAVGVVATSRRDQAQLVDAALRDTVGPRST
jgi:hypothetical protein